MKVNAIVLFITIFLVPGFAAAQNQINAGVKVLKPVSVVTYEPVTVLEAGTGNRIRITAGDSTVKRILVNASQGTVKQQGKDFIIHPEKPGEIILKIYNNNDLVNPVLIDEKVLEVVVAPFVTFGGKHGGEISREEIRQVSRVETSGMNDESKILEFKLSVAGKGIEYKEFFAKSDSLTGEMLTRLREIPAGSKIFIEYIRAGNEFSSRQLPPVELTVVN